MRNPRELSPDDIADDLVKLHNLPKNDQSTHEALLQEVNGYFRYKINELKQKAAAGQTWDLRGDVICLFKNVVNSTSFDQRPGPKAPFDLAVIDETVKNGRSVFEQEGYEPDCNRIPTCFQISDNRLGGFSFSVKTNGDNNADYLYLVSQRQPAPFNQQYKTWSQYWGSGKTSLTPPYKPAERQPYRTKSKWES